MAKFELVDEEPVKNILFYQVQEMGIGQFSDLMDRIGDKICDLDEETAKKVDECNRGSDWFNYLTSVGGELNTTNTVIVNFLNARHSYRIRKARGSVKKTLHTPLTKDTQVVGNA